MLFTKFTIFAIRINTPTRRASALGEHRLQHSLVTTLGILANPAHRWLRQLQTGQFALRDVTMKCVRPGTNRRGVSFTITTMEIIINNDKDIFFRYTRGGGGTLGGITVSLSIKG